MFVWVKMLKGHPLRLYLTSSLLFIVSVSFSSYEGTAASSRIRSWFKTVILSQQHWLQGTSCAVERPLCFLLCDVLKCAFAIWKVLSLFLPETPNSQNHISVTYFMKFLNHGWKDICEISLDAPNTELTLWLHDAQHSWVVTTMHPWQPVK